jgi:hypothetical protein
MLGLAPVAERGCEGFIRMAFSIVGAVGLFILLGFETEDCGAVA